MDENEIVPQDEENNSWKANTLLIGGLVGALVGLGTAFLLIKRSEQQGKPLHISPGKGVQMGALIAGLLRSILSLGEN